MGDYKKSKKTVFLPTVLVDEVNSLELTKTQKSYTFKFLWMVMRDSYWKTKSIYSPIDRPFKHMEANYTKKYNNWLKLLLDKHIVKRTSYSNNNCFKYYISKQYNNLPTWLLCSSSFNNDLTEVTYFEKIIPENKYMKWFREDLNSLNIDKEDLEVEFQKRVTNITIDSCGVEVVDELLPGMYKLYYSTGDKREFKFSTHGEINHLSITDQKIIIKTSKGG